MLSGITLVIIYNNQGSVNLLQIQLCWYNFKISIIISKYVYYFISIKNFNRILKDQSFEFYQV